MITWPCDQKVTWICCRSLSPLAHQPGKYGGQKSCRRRDIIYVGTKLWNWMDMIILLQGVTTQFHRFFWHILFCKVQQSNFFAKCDNLLLQGSSGITNCDNYYKVRRNTFLMFPFFLFRFPFTILAIGNINFFLKPGLRKVTLRLLKSFDHSFQRSCWLFTQFHLI